MKISLRAAVCVGALALSATAHAGSLIGNGGFETGGFAPWVETDEAGGSGSWYIQQYGQGTALNSFPTPTQSGGGTYFASTDQFGPGSHTLSQTFNGTPGGTYTLSFDAYVSDQSGQAPVGSGPDYNTVPNQHSEVDLNGIQVYYGAFTPGWQTYTFNVSGDILSGANVLSFNEVDNQGFYNEGLDNVSLTTGVPEPATWAMMLIGVAAAGATLRRRVRGAVA